MAKKNVVSEQANQNLGGGKFLYFEVKGKRKEWACGIVNNAGSPATALVASDDVRYATHMKLTPAYVGDKDKVEKRMKSFLSKFFGDCNEFSIFEARVYFKGQMLGEFKRTSSDPATVQMGRITDDSISPGLIPSVPASAKFWPACLKKETK